MIKNQPLYHILFEDSSTYEGGNLNNTLWKDVPNKQISRLFYLLPTGDYLALGGYEKYYQYIEATKDFYGGNGTINLENVYLLGKKGKQINQYKIDLKTGSIERKELKEEELKINNEFWR